MIEIKDYVIVDISATKKEVQNFCEAVQELDHVADHYTKTSYQFPSPWLHMEFKDYTHFVFYIRASGDCGYDWMSYWESDRRKKDKKYDEYVQIKWEDLLDEIASS